MDRPTWLQFPVQNGKRKRAELACEVCHSRKVKCDLQVRCSEGLSNCSNCAAASRDCRPRQSRRERARRTTGARGGAHPLTPPGDSNNEGEVDGIAPELNETVVVPTDLATMSGSVFLQPTNVLVSGQTSDTAQQTHHSTPTNSIHTPGQDLASRGNLRSQSVTSAVTSVLVRNEHPHSYSADTGFLQIYGPENQSDAMNQELANQARRRSDRLGDAPPSDLLQGFSEIYFEYCYTWCPVLDKSTLSEDLTQSLMLSNALALAGSHIQPPMIPHAGPAVYYDRAKRLFYDEEESDIMLTLKALSLFYWWSPKPPTAVHKNSSWWWQSVIIRHAQQIGVHREPGIHHPLRAELDLSLRRRIWWTAFARERLTAMCQSRPAIIDPDDCNIQEPTLADFPEPRDEMKAEIFIHWVRLCSIIGRIAKCLSHTYAPSPTTFPEHLARELISWVHSLPVHLRLPIETGYTTNFNRDIHQLYLPYLAVIIVLHLKRSSQSLPHARPPAILAASCIARILKDILNRGMARSLMAITCWYTGTAFIGLLAASQNISISQGANADLDILTLAIKQLKNMWPTATIFDQGFERLRAGAGVGSSAVNATTDTGERSTLLTNTSATARTERVSSGSGDDGIDWMEYFPFVTPATSKVAEKLLEERNRDMTFDNEAFPESMMLYFQDLFEPYDGLADMTLFT